MKKHFTQILSIFLSGIMLTGAAAFSAGAAPKEQQRFTEITVKKSEILQKGAFKAIQSALNAARYSATKDNRYKIIVEPGSYDLRSALHIYSNTTLSLYNVVFVRNKEAVTNMIRTGEDTAVNKGDSGYAANANISIEGGTLDGNGTSNTMIKVTHASNFSMVGTEVCNLRNAHMIRKHRRQCRLRGDPARYPQERPHRRYALRGAQYEACAYRGLYFQQLSARHRLTHPDPQPAL